MARSKYKPYESIYKPNVKETFVRITHSMLSSNAFKSLKPYSIKLYLYMLDWSKGKLELEYTITLAEKILPSSTAQKAFKDLIKNGFIEIARKGCFANRTATTYKFSSKWKTL